MHPVSRDDASIPDISVSAVNTTTIRTPLVRILHLRYKTACFPWKNEGSRTTLANHWTTHQGPRQRTRRRSTCRHGHAWTCRKAKAIGQKCEKPWENQGFAAERTVTELLGVFSVFFTIGWEILPPNDSAAPASNEPLRISLGIATKNGAGGDRVSKVLAEPLVL
jgi:hypothetical protein